MDEIRLYVRLHQPGIVPNVYKRQMLGFQHQDFAINDESTVMTVNTFHGDLRPSLWVNSTSS